MVPVAQQISQIGLATADQLSAYRPGERDATLRRNAATTPRSRSPSSVVGDTSSSFGLR